MQRFRLHQVIRAQASQWPLKTETHKIKLSKCLSILQTDKCKPMISLWSCSSLWATRLSFISLEARWLHDSSGLNLYFLKYVLWISIRWAEMFSPLGILHKLKARKHLEARVCQEIQDSIRKSKVTIIIIQVKSNGLIVSYLLGYNFGSYGSL